MLEVLLGYITGLADAITSIVDTIKGFVGAITGKSDVEENNNEEIPVTLQAYGMYME